MRISGLEGEHVTDETPEVFRGHFDECLDLLGKELGRFPKGTRAAGSAKKPIIEFCGVAQSTVKLWLNGMDLPRGVNRLKAICYLDLIGYRVIEFESHPSDVKGFIELIGYGVLDVAEAAQLIGFSQTGRIYEVLSGNQTLSEAKRQSMWELWQERKEALEQKKQKAAKLYGPKARPEVSARRRKGTVGPSVTTRPAVLSLMEALLALLEEEHSQELLEKALSNHPSEGTTVLLLSARLSALSSQLAAEQAQMQVVDHDA